MYARQITSEQMYTLKEARKIIELERAEKREVFLHKAKQKMLGILAIGVSIASPLLLDGDATISVFMLPLGLCVFFTKVNVFDYKED